MFEFLFGPTNPTKHWQRLPDLRLDFDLERAKLNGVGLGDPLETLSFLGPLEDRGLFRNIEEYGYFSLGLVVGCHNDERAIDCFEIVRSDRLSPRYRPYAGRFHYRGRDISLADLTELQFTDTFGAPYWRNEDDDEILLFYELPKVEWQVEFDPAGDFQRIVVESEPLLADLRAREAFGVSRPWPPGT